MPTRTHTIGCNYGVTGIAASVFYTVKDGQGNVLLTRRNTAVVEDPAGTGAYLVRNVAWEQGLEVFVTFDKNDGDPANTLVQHWPVEDINIALANGAPYAPPPPLIEETQFTDTVVTNE